MKRLLTSPLLRPVSILLGLTLSLACWELARQLPGALWWQSLFAPNLADVSQAVVYFSWLPRLVVTLLAGAALGLSGCGSANGDAAPVAPAADAAPLAAIATPAQAPTHDAVRFTSGTSYAATGAQAEIALSVTEVSARDVLERIATDKPSMLAAEIDSLATKQLN